MPLEVYPLEIFGEMEQYNSPTVGIVTINTIDVWEIINGMSEGEIRNFTFQNAQELKCLVAGVYDVDYSLCWTDGVGNIYEFVIFINDIIQTKTLACGRKSNSIDIVTSSSTGILDLAVDDIITLRVRNRTSTQDLEVVSANTNLSWRGISE